MATLLWSTAQGGVNIGDPAPELSVTEWVKGEPINLAKGKGRHAYLIEFWATWCPPCIEMIPHITELQHKYRDQGLVIVGVSGPGRGETLTKVKRFVRRRSESMDYVIGWDKEGVTHARYMGSVGAFGIPYAFLIDKSGRLVWHGHPGDPVMDEIIDQVMNGRYDIESAIRQDKLTPMFERLDHAARVGDWDSFKTVVGHILSLDPSNEYALSAMIYGHVMMSDDAQGMREFVEQHIEVHGQDVEAMNALARSLLAIQEIELRQPDLALRAATVGYEACKGGDCTMVDTYARAVFEIGLVDRAIEIQSTAVAVAPDEPTREAMERALEYYKKCKALQSGNL